MDKKSTNKTNKQMVGNRSQRQKLLQQKVKVGWKAAIKGRINLVPTQNSPTDLCLFAASHKPGASLSADVDLRGEISYIKD